MAQYTEYTEQRRPYAVIGATTTASSKRILGMFASIGGHAAIIPFGFYRPDLLMGGNIAGALAASREDTNYMRSLRRKYGWPGDENPAIREARKARRADRFNAFVSLVPAAERALVGSESLISWAVTIPAVLLLSRYATRKIQKARENELAIDFGETISRAEMTIGQLEEYFGILQGEEMRLREKGYKNRNDRKETRLIGLIKLLREVNGELNKRYAALEQPQQ